MRDGGDAVETPWRHRGDTGETLVRGGHDEPQVRALKAELEEIFWKLCAHRITRRRFLEKGQLLLWASLWMDFVSFFWFCHWPAKDPRMFSLFTEPARSLPSGHWLSFYARRKIRAPAFCSLVGVDELCETFLMIRDLSKMYPVVRHQVSGAESTSPGRRVRTRADPQPRVWCVISSHQVSVPPRARTDNCAHCRIAAAACVCMCVCACAWVNVQEEWEKPKGHPCKTERPIVIYSLASVRVHVCVCVCVSWHFGDSGGSVVPLFPRMLSARGWGPTPAGAAVQVHCHRVLRPDQGGVPVPASPVPQVRVRVENGAWRHLLIGQMFSKYYWNFHYWVKEWVLLWNCNN